MILITLATPRSKLGAPADPPPSKHAELLTYRAADGQDRPVKSTADWSLRRRQILTGMQQAMGDLPGRDRLVPLDVRVSEEVREEKFNCASADVGSRRAGSDRGLALFPAGQSPCRRKAARRSPALHPTGALGKKRSTARETDRAYGRELAERGYIVLAPDYPTFGDYPCDFSDPRFASGSILGVFNHIRCIDWLVSRDDVDAGRIGAIGHSLGGHNAMFLAALDERVKATVSSCGWDPFH